jgi:hypothetical protein
MHFCVHAPGLELLLNFSLAEDLRPSASPGSECCRLTVVVRTQGWDGAVEVFEPSEVIVRQGRIALDFGPNSLRFEHGAYHLKIQLRSRPIHLNLRLVPLTHPALCSGVPVGTGSPIDWLVLPHLRATGQVSIDSRVFNLHDAAAYHDHNWGHFAWGGGFTWEWCYAVGAERSALWSVVLVRLLDRGRNRVFTQALFLWRGSQLHRVFRDRDLKSHQQGLFQGPSKGGRPFRIPRVAGLLVNTDLSGVPARLITEARGDGDTVRLDFQVQDLAQVVIPADADPLGVAIINETWGELQVEGRVRGESFALKGPAFYEVVHA